MNIVMTIDITFMLIEIKGEIMFREMKLLGVNLMKNLQVDH